MRSSTLGSLEVHPAQSRADLVELLRTALPLTSWLESVEAQRRYFKIV